MISVLIPVYNQYQSLDIVLWHFCRQTCTELFEIIIVDDGSTEYCEEIINKYKMLNIVYIRNEKNMGRSYARNNAIENSQGEYLIFCDCDRIPIPEFIDEHLKILYSNDRVLSVGYSTETYESLVGLKMVIDRINRRKSIYYNAISNIYDVYGKTDSHLCWLSTLSGNMAIKKSELLSYYFDVDFMDWGFEHFELGYRLWKEGISFVNNKNAENIHIAHKRNSGFYEECIKNSFKIFFNKHPDKEVFFLEKFILGDISLQEYELKINGNTGWFKNVEKEVRVNRINI